MPRITDAFARIRSEHRAGLVTYITAGDPTLARTADILPALDRAGADVIEVGVPFSDPLADGPVIQRASERALAAGATLDGVLEMIAAVRASVHAPIVLFSYANPMYRMGFPAFASRAARAGVDGVLTLDVPMEESHALRQELVANGIDMIFLLSPTTTVERMRLAGELGSGFVYAISRLGVTGARAEMAAGIGGFVQCIRLCTTLPVAVGFGLSRPDHVAAIGSIADAAVVGSALVQVIADAGDTPELVPCVETFVRSPRGLR
ncbi:MAG: tryptophan synthase subunit alpha [Acidobacteria bacterium]|nr:tryptophan synthase subunit alpha [Acidobacteriota bacterium]